MTLRENIPEWVYVEADTKDYSIVLPPPVRGQPWVTSFNNSGDWIDHDLLMNMGWVMVEVAPKVWWGISTK